jgi:enamine deaminase RidA (YjgF/YER057c/UK114 family)
MGTFPSFGRSARLRVFIAATPDFTEHSKVGNGASDLFISVLGDIGRHARTAIGVASLPLGVAVEIDAIVELEG